MVIAVSYFSLASMAALALFLLIMIPRALFHIAAVVVGAATRKPPGSDPWLIAIGVSFLICAGLAGLTYAYHAGAKNLAGAYGGVTFAFLLFAAPAVLQVLRAWANVHAKKVKVLSHALVALAVLSLPASMAIPTAALLQSTVQAATASAAPADNPAASIADEQYFTDNEVANDPDDYPIATWMANNLTFKRTLHTDPNMKGQNFYRQIPTYTGYWFDQTANALSFEATDTFGVLVSSITHVRANLAFSTAVFLYKLMCAIVLVAVAFNVIFGPMAGRLHKTSRNSFG
ncbi:MAG TPA: hypothetical protein VG407_15415 [Caulobacteraceae bacterium]|nr:hypothetical protein [Caulobacteraceae bacterium]